MKLYSLILLASLAACGGGGASSPVEQPSVVNIAPASAPIFYKKLTIEMYGDSSLQGSNVDPKEVANPCELMQSAVNARYGVDQVGVRCQAFGSESADLVSGGSQYIGGPWPQILSYNSTSKDYTKPVPDVVLINHNLNDIRNQRSLADYRKNMEFLVVQAKAVGVKTVVLENSVPLTTKPPYGASQSVLDTQPAFLDALSAVATANAAPLVDTYGTVKAAPNWESYITDSIHPNAKMYQIISDNRVKTLLPLLDNLRQP